MPSRSSKGGIRFAGVLAAAGALALAQTAQTPATEKPATVAGQVTNSVTGEPLLRAHVTLRGFNRANGTQDRNFGAMTNAEGKFSITAVAAGSYMISAERVGFVMPDEQPEATWRIQVQAGDQKEDLKLKLTPVGVIAGRVLDAADAPMEGVSVSAEGGGGSQNATTDDKGQFRIGGLRPGKYRVKAMPPHLPFPREIRTDGTQEVHNAATWYPNSLVSKTASRVPVTAGTETGAIDIRLIRTPIVRVSGTVEGAPASGPTTPMTQIQVQRMDEPQNGGGMNMGNTVKKDGTFELWQLDPGKYTVTAVSFGAGRQLVSAPVDVEVAGANIDHVALRMVPPFDISGRMDFDDEQARQPPQQPQQQVRQMRAGGTQQAQPSPQPRRLMLQSVSGMMFGMNPTVEIAADDTFTLEKVQPGRYRVNLTWGPYVKSMKLGDTDMEGAILDVRNGSGGAALTVLASSATGEIMGTVRDAPAGVMVALVLDEGWASSRMNMVRRTATAADGTYSFRGIAPGKYKLAAVDQGANDLSGEAMDRYEDVLETVDLHVGDKLTMELRQHAPGK